MRSSCTAAMYNQTAGDGLHGSTTNIAARLAALCEGGSVVISEETRRLHSTFAAEDLGCQPLKHVKQPVCVYRIDVALSEGSAPA